MSARLRSSLHPLTVASIDMQRDDCCGDDPNWVRLCPYHRGLQDGIDQLLDQQEVKSETGSHLSAAFSSFYSVAADEIVRLREELGDLEAYAAAWTDTANRHARTADSWQARAERAEADADRLAAEVMRLMCACTWRTPGVIGYRCTKCVALDLHDKEVEAR